MLSIRNVIVASLFASSILAQQTPLPSQDGVRAEPDFHEILNSLPEESLHAALHKEVEPQFQDGVYEKASVAVKAIHKTNARLASKVIAEARYELIRRQANNVTTTSQPPPVTTSAAPTVSSGAVVVTSTNAAGETVVATFTPSGGVVSSLVLQTTTLPNGQMSTFTSFKVVPASSTGSSTNGPKLQNGAAGLARGRNFALEITALMIGSIGIGFLLL